MIRNALLMLAMLLAGSPCAFANEELERSIALLDCLGTTSLEAEYENQPLVDVIADLSSHLEVPIWVDWEALRSIGVDNRDRIDLQLTRCHASTVFSALTINLGDEFNRPVFEAMNDAFVLTTYSGAAAMRQTDVYDVRDLLAQPRSVRQLRESRGGTHSSPPETAPASETNDESAVIEDDSGLPPIEIDQKRLPRTPGEELILLITEHVDPDAWLNYGGTIAKISDRDGMVVVTAPPTIHRKLRDALLMLRQAYPTAVAFDAVIVDLPREALTQLKRRYAGDSLGLARSVLMDERTVMHWAATPSVAIGKVAEIESKADAAHILLRLAPEQDAQTGVLTVSVRVSQSEEGDLRRIDTTVAMPLRRAASLIELSATHAADSARLLILMPTRT